MSLSKQTILVSLKKAVDSSLDKGSAFDKWDSLRDQISNLVAMLEHEERVDKAAKQE